MPNTFSNCSTVFRIVWFSAIHQKIGQKNKIILEPDSIKSPDNKNISVYNNFIIVKKDIIKIFMDKEHISENNVRKLISGNGMNIIVINNSSEKTILIGNIINKEHTFELLYILNYKHSNDLEYALKNIKENSFNYIYNYLMFGDEEYLVSPIFNKNGMIIGYGYRNNDSILYELLNEYYRQD